MKLPPLIITIMSLTLSNNVKQTTKINQLIFDGFDCRNPNKIVSFLTKDWCTPTNSSLQRLGGEKDCNYTTRRQVSNSKRNSMYQTSVEIPCLLWKLFPHEAFRPSHDSRAFSHNDRRMLRHV